MGVTVKKCHMIMSGNDCWNSLCFSCCRKADNELADVTLSGRLFQNCAAAIGNARPPMVDSLIELVFGTEAILGSSYTVLTRITPKITAHPSGTLSQTLDLEKLRHGTSIVASVVNLVRPSPAYHTECPPLCRPTIRYA